MVQLVIVNIFVYHIWYWDFIKIIKLVYMVAKKMSYDYQGLDKMGHFYGL